MEGQRCPRVAAGQITQLSSCLTQNRCMILEELLFAGHGLLAFTYLNPYVPVILIGLAYSLLASALWPIAALIIPEYQLGTAYGA